MFPIRVLQPLPSPFQVYRNNKAQIDPVLEKVKAHYKEISDKVSAMLPQGKAVETKKEE